MALQATGVASPAVLLGAWIIVDTQQSAANMQQLADTKNKGALSSIRQGAPSRKMHIHMIPQVPITSPWESYHPSHVHFDGDRLVVEEDPHTPPI